MAWKTNLIITDSPMGKEETVNQLQINANSTSKKKTWPKRRTLKTRTNTLNSRETVKRIECAEIQSWHVQQAIQNTGGLINT